MMIDQETLDRWVTLARQDDWHGRFVGSDIRIMLGEIERLRAALTKIAGDEKNCAEHCRRQAARALEQLPPDAK